VADRGLCVRLHARDRRDVLAYWAAIWIAVRDELILTGHGGNLTGTSSKARACAGLGQTTAPVSCSASYAGIRCSVRCGDARPNDGRGRDRDVTIVLQMCCTASPSGSSCGGSSRFGLPIACLLGILIALLPKQLVYTQVDSVIAPVALLVRRADRYLQRASHDGSAPLWVFLLINAAFRRGSCFERCAGRLALVSSRSPAGAGAGSSSLSR